MGEPCMNLLLFILIFSCGLILGLVAGPFARIFDSKAINDFLDAFARIVVAPFSLLTRYFRKKSDFSKARQGVNGEADDKVDAREQQISDSAQTIRSILLSLATVIQRTDKAASDSAQALDEVKSSIDRMELPEDLADAHSALVQEVDRVISSNTNLKGELAISQAILASQRLQIEVLQTAVRIDGLTQLANRAYFDEKLSEMIKLRRRYEEPFALMMIDLDNFKEINDSFGHPAGDRILKGVAFKIKEALRGSDFLARFGGDEFAVILIKTGGKSAADVAWKLCSNLRESRFLLDATAITATLSIGVAEADAADTEESLLKRADEALYRVKQVGRNSVLLAENPLRDDSDKTIRTK
jgi:diguanylate cyclase